MKTRMRLLVMAAVSITLTTVAHRPLVHFGSMDTIKCRIDVRRQTSSSRRIGDSMNDIVLVKARSRKKNTYSDDVDDEEAATNKLWPPWPFNLIGKKSGPKAEDGYPTTGSLVWAYIRQRSRVGIRQIQQLGSELWFHLPPATPPLVILAAIPLKNGEQRIPAFFVNSFVRNLVFASMGLAVMSWAHAELDRQQILEPLPIPPQYRDIARAFLPPFLPDEVEQDIDLDMTVDHMPIEKLQVKADDEDVDAEEVVLQRKLRKQWRHIYDSTPRPESLKFTIQEWRIKQRSRRTQSERAKRMGIYDELVALQGLKKKVTQRRKKYRQRGAAMQQPNDPQEVLGYALVTGASRGIGRALAVELARWEIPLILVARDEQRLMNLATDIERCYGVKCCVLLADLSQPNAAEKIYEATQAAGLKVEILVNNAGLSSSGDFVDMDVSSLQNILQVNALSVASLSLLYGKEMKKRKRGRILIVSSILGVAYAGPTVAAYAATKSFERVLGLSMAKELEAYGVGVTCLLPGAVGDSSFRRSSGSSEALCWKIPFYVKSCAEVAQQGVRAMLQGDLETIPGWQNRAFAKVMLPVLPQRGLTLVTEAAWTPLSHWFRDRPIPRRSRRLLSPEVQKPSELVTPEVSPESSTKTPWSGYMYVPKNPPRMLHLLESQEESEPSESLENETEAEVLDSSGEPAFPKSTGEANEPTPSESTDGIVAPEMTEEMTTPETTDKRVDAELATPAGEIDASNDNVKPIIDGEANQINDDVEPHVDEELITRADS